ncbi:hypothetical protein CRG98_012493 [Punica granatum]|uniref:Uncharacterized protein n=1 Tax=Punica granatum TaxID=22663 RepID=A0A2I0KFQ1_PUNGR|nr:hypothetical protein CRG98_012493 [Punica granatum]
MTTPSHSCPSCILGKVDTPKLRDSVACMLALTRAHSGKQHCDRPRANGPTHAYSSPNACVSSPIGQQPHAATAYPNGCPSPTGGFLNVEPDYLRATATVNAGPASDLHSSPAEDLPGVECFCSCSTYRAISLLDLTTKYKLPIPSPTAPKYAHPRTRHANSRGPCIFVKALQANDSRQSTSYLDLNLFPGMPLPPKIKLPDF